MPPMETGRTPSPQQATRWLTPDELDTWMALNHLIARLPAVLGAQLQCDADLSYVEYYVLASLSDQPAQCTRMSQLANLANSELSRLSHLIARLERRGLVRREPDPTDGRFTNAILTEAGRTYLAEAAPAHVEKVRSMVFDTLDQNSQHALRDAAKAIVTRLEEETA